MSTQDSLQVEGSGRSGPVEASPQFQASDASTTMNTTHKSGFNFKAHNRQSNHDLGNGASLDPLEGLNGGEENGEKKKKKKKNKNKNKKKGTAAAAAEGETAANVTGFKNPNSHKQQNDSSLCDKTQSTLHGYTENGANGAVADAGADFTPLRDQLGQSFFEDQDSSEDEGMPDYKIGGYHPVHVGEILLDRYVIIQKLGWGHFSTVWLTKDLKYNNYVAMKVQKSAQHYLEAAYDEVEILDKVASNWKTEEWS